MSGCGRGNDRGGDTDHNSSLNRFRYCLSNYLTVPGVFKAFAPNKVLKPKIEATIFLFTPFEILLKTPLVVPSKLS